MSLKCTVVQLEQEKAGGERSEGDAHGDAQVCDALARTKVYEPYTKVYEPNKQKSMSLK